VKQEPDLAYRIRAFRDEAPCRSRTRIHDCTISDAFLDLCCGTGQISRILADRGFNVVGLDASASLVGLARKNAPNAHFEVADAKFFSSPDRFQAAISLNDSLNHLLSIEDLKSAFLNVYKCMVPGGVFLFDLNLAHKYESSWAGSFSIVEEDAVCCL
jgi:SAM-dependent methyltransferase